MLGSYIERDDTDSRGRGERRPSRARIGSVAFVRVGRSSSVRLARVSRATTRDGTGRDGTGSMSVCPISVFCGIRVWWWFVCLCMY